MSVTRLKIFISSVQKELAEERRAVKSFIENDALPPVNQRAHKGLKGLMAAGHKQGNSAKTLIKQRNAATTSIKTPVKSSPKSSLKSSGKTLGKTPGKTPGKIMELLSGDPMLSIPALALELSKSESAVERAVRKLRKSGRLRRIGPAKGGHWETIDKNEG